MESRKKLGLNTTGFSRTLLTSAKASTNASQHQYAKLMFYFLGLLGDYDSMHMFAKE
jgi:hypothetical protein